MFDWKRIRLIAGREVRTRVAMNSYRWSLIVQVLIVALIAMSPVFIAKFTSDDGPTVRNVAVVNATDVDASTGLNAAVALLTADSDTTWSLAEVDTEEEARTQLDNGDIDAVVLIVPEGEELAFTILTESGDPQSSTAQILIAASSSLSVSHSIEQSGLTQSEVSDVFAAPALQITQADPEAESEEEGIGDIVNYVIAYASTIVIFIFVVMYGQWIAQGVVEEKASRIMEIMVNAATPRDLLAGKVIGIMITALMQFIPIVLTAGIIASFQTQIGSLFGVPEDQLFDINLGAIAWSSMGWFLLYFILGFLLFGALYAGVGSLVSRQEEVGTAIAPMMTVMMIGYFAALMSLNDPDGTIARVAYLFPGTSVFVAMLRLVMGNPEPWEIAVSIGGLLIAIVLALLLAARLYRVGVLMYGQTPKFTEMFKIGKMEGVSR